MRYVACIVQLKVVTLCALTMCFQECELKHVYDPTLPLRSRFERSASQNQHAIESPLDAADALRTQQVPHRIARGTVRDKTRAYLSNYGEVEVTPGLLLDDISEGWEEGADYPDEGEGDEDVYPYEEGDSGLGLGLGAAVGSGSVRSGRSSNPSQRSGTRPPVAVPPSLRSGGGSTSGRTAVMRDINAEVVSDLDEDGTDSYSYRQPAAHDGELEDTVLQSYTPHSAGRSRASSGPCQPAAPLSRPQSFRTSGTGDSSVRSETSGVGSRGGVNHGVQPVSRAPLSPTRSLSYTPSPLTTPVVPSSATRRPFAGAGPSPQLQRTLSPVAMSATAPSPARNASPVAVAITVPAYAYNNPQTFVPKKGDAPAVVVTSPARIPEARLHHAPTHVTSAGAFSGQQGMSARRWEREQARRLRTAAARAETEGYDQEGLPPSDADGLVYGAHSPTSSLSSHNDSTSPSHSQSLPRSASGTGSSLPPSAARTGRAEASQGVVVNSPASTDRETRDTVRPGSGLPPVLATLSTPITAHRAHGQANLPPSGRKTEAPEDPAAQGHEEVAGSEEDGYGDGSESYLSEDDDLSFNTAEEINTPMLTRAQMHRHRDTVRTGRKGVGRTPKTGGPRGHHGAGTGAGGAVDVAQLKEALFRHLLVGDANAVTEVLKTAYNAVPAVPVSALILPDQSSELMLQCFKEPGSLIHDDQTLKVLLDTLRADVNHVESDTSRTLLHYTVEQGERKLARILVAKGADVLMEDNTGTSALAMSLRLKQDWVLAEFQSSGRMVQLLQSDDTDRKTRLAKCLILAGHSQLAAEVIRLGGLQFTAAEASQLLASCRGNFEDMKDPIETFELLESLGAVC
jgi:hypothetical protein